MAALPREQQLCNGISPWLSPMAMVLTQDLVVPGFFAGVTVLDADNLPHSGPVLLAPTHRARWDALLLPHAAGRRVSGRDCRFMVTRDEMLGMQGWFLRVARQRSHELFTLNMLLAALFFAWLTAKAFESGLHVGQFDDASQFGLQLGHHIGGSACGYKNAIPSAHLKS